MFRVAMGVAVACSALAAASPSLAASACSRASLQKATDSYIAAQTKGEPALMLAAKAMKYIENRKDVDPKAGVVAAPQKIDLHRSLLDTETCETFTEVVITNPGHPYVLGVHLKAPGGKIAEVDTIVTQKDDWLFAPARTLKFSSAEDWSVLPKAARSDRRTLIAAADAYFDYFDDKSKKTVVPWGIPCHRLEGALYTGKGQPDDSCDVGVPDKVKIVNRHYVVDEDIGAVVGLVTFGTNGLPDSHLFRLENGKIRYIHTITHCFTPNCGFPVPAVLKAAP